MFVIVNKQGLYILDDKSVVYNSNHAKQFETWESAFSFLAKIAGKDSAFNVKEWDVKNV